MLPSGLQRFSLKICHWLATISASRQKAKITRRYEMILLVIVKDVQFFFFFSLHVALFSVKTASNNKVIAMYL